MFRGKADKKFKALDEALARAKNGEPIESVISAYPEQEREAAMRMVELVTAVRAMPKAIAPTPVKRRLYLDPAYQKTRSGVLSFIRSFQTFGYGFAAAVVVIIGIGTAYAANISLPGDRLFALKAAYEDIQIKLATTPENRARLQIEIASQRLQDAQTVLASNADSSAKSAAIDELNSATSLAINNIQSVVASPAIKNDKALIQKVESLAAAQQQLAPGTSNPSQAQALADIKDTVAAAQTEQNTASIPTSTKISITGKIVAIKSGKITVDTNAFTMDPKNLKITDTDGFNLSFAALGIGQTVKIDGRIIDSSTNQADVITITNKNLPAATPTTQQPATVQAPVQQPAAPQIPVKPNDTFGGVIFEK